MPVAARRQGDQNMTLDGVAVTSSAADLNTLLGLAGTGAMLKTALVTVTSSVVPE